MNKKIVVPAILLTVFIVVISLVAFARADTITVVINSPTNTTYGNSSIFINVTAATYGAIDQVIAEIDASQNVTLTRYLSTNYYTINQTLADGNHVIRIFANDTVGDSDSSQKVYFTVDTTPPTVTINSPMNTTYEYHGIMINATVSDLSPISKVIAEIDGTTNVTLTLSGGFYTNNSTSFTWGNHVIRIFANDSLGHMNSAQTVYFNVTVSLADFPYPFINSSGGLNMTIVVPSSSPHPPCGGANTMDVMSAVSIGVLLGQSSNSSVFFQYVTMDDYISSYNGTAVSFTALTDRNLIVMAGPGVSQEAYYYNSLKKNGGYAPYGFALPVTLLNYGNGTNYLQVWPSNNTYKIQYNGSTVVADYGVIQLYYDNTYGRYVLLVGGLGGYGTEAAAIVLSNYANYALSGKAVIIKYYDSNGDGILDTISIVETVS